MDQDPKLQKTAFYWQSESDVSTKKEEEDKLKQQEGEKFATLQKAINLEPTKNQEKKSRKSDQKF